jgi:hypothetical protein
MQQDEATAGALGFFDFCQLRTVVEMKQGKNRETET